MEDVLCELESVARGRTRRRRQKEDRPRRRGAIPSAVQLRLTHCRAVRRQRGDAFVLSSRLAAARRAAPRRPPCYADGEKESSKTRSGHRRERDRESGSVVRGGVETAAASCTIEEYRYVET